MMDSELRQTLKTLHHEKPWKNRKIVKLWRWRLRISWQRCVRSVLSDRPAWFYE